jgi:cob(I)alamin adenosyltransferase
VVTLSRISTRTGDAGQTRLGDATQVAKDDPRVECLGAVDELNAALGVALSAGLPSGHAEILGEVQHDLFDLGADLCLPLAAPQAARQPLRVTASQVSRLEGWIGELNALLPVLRSFVLPGGAVAGAWLHLARTVCRRAERRLWTLHAATGVSPAAGPYLNRLSDLLFVMARDANRRQGAERLWEPGRGRQCQEEDDAGAS